MSEEQQVTTVLPAPQRKKRKSPSSPSSTTRSPNSVETVSGDIDRSLSTSRLHGDDAEAVSALALVAASLPREDESVSPKPKKREPLPAATPASNVLLANSKKRRKNPSAPKNPRSAYLFYVAEQRSSMARQKHNLSFTEIARIVGRRWKGLSKQQRQPYDDMAKADYERYRREKADYQRLQELDRQSRIAEAYDDARSQRTQPVPNDNEDQQQQQQHRSNHELESILQAMQAGRGCNSNVASALGGTLPPVVGADMQIGGPNTNMLRLLLQLHGSIGGAQTDATATSPTDAAGSSDSTQALSQQLLAQLAVVQARQSEVETRLEKLRTEMARFVALQHQYVSQSGVALPGAGLPQQQHHHQLGTATTTTTPVPAAAAVAGVLPQLSSSQPSLTGFQQSGDHFHPASASFLGSGLGVMPAMFGAGAMSGQASLLPATGGTALPWLSTFMMSQPNLATTSPAMASPTKGPTTSMSADLQQM